MTDKPIAIKYSGSWTDYSGYGEANRNIIYALHKVGVELTTEKVSFVRDQSDYGEAYEVCQRLENKSIDYKIKIIHLTPDHYLKHLEAGKYHIGHLFWETDKILDAWVWMCNRLDEIWTGSETAKKALIHSGVRIPIWVFPQPIIIDKNIYNSFVTPNHKGFLFYSIFEWTERKNPKALLQAFWQEFTEEDNVSLLLKVFRDDFRHQNHKVIKDQIKKWKEEIILKQFPRVLYHNELFSKQDLYRVHATGDCFVSAHRGEGWGRPQMEAMMLGKPVITTNYGGIHEYLNDTVAYLTTYQMQPVIAEDDRPFYTKDQNWAEVDILDLRAKMRMVFEDKEKAKKVGLLASKFIKERFNPELVGNMMKERLEAISQNL